MTNSTLAIVRCAQDAGLPAMLRMIVRNDLLEESGITQTQRHTWNLMLSNNDVTPYMAEIAGVAVGYTVRHLTYDCRPGLLIESMFVLPEQRRQGVARMMITKVLDDARARGIYKVQLLTHKRHAQDGAHARYRSAGFVAEAEGFRLYLE